MFSGLSGTEKKPYSTTLDFYSNVIPSDFQSFKTGQNLFFIIRKAEPGYWPRLLTQKEKMRWLKTDFGRWKDEDEEDEEEASPFMNGNPFGDMMGMGMDQFGGGMQNFDLPADSDDEEEVVETQ